MYLFQMVIFHSYEYVSLPEGSSVGLQNRRLIMGGTSNGLTVSAFAKMALVWFHLDVSVVFQKSVSLPPGHRHPN